MSKNSLFIFLVFFSAVSLAQKKPGTIKVKKPDEPKKEVPTLDTSTARKMEHGRYFHSLFYGHQYIELKGLNNGIFHNGNSFTPFQYIYGVEIGAAENIYRRGSGYTSAFNYTRIHPQKVADSDSSDYTLTGYKFHIINFGINILPANSFIHLYIYPGLEYGRLKLVRQFTDGTKYSYKDPFFLLNPMAEIRIRSFNIGRIMTMIGVRGGYSYDIGNPKWKKLKGDGPDLPGTKMRGYYYEGLLSFSFY